MTDVFSRKQDLEEWDILSHGFPEHVCSCLSFHQQAQYQMSFTSSLMGFNTDVTISHCFLLTLVLYSMKFSFMLCLI